MRRTKKEWKYDNFAELLRVLGDIPPERICLNPPPGMATNRDLLRGDGRKSKLYELVERTLIAKPLGAPESFLAVEMSFSLHRYLDRNDLGFLCGPNVLVRFARGLVLSPDVSFFPWTLRPEKTVPRDQISRLIPELVVEILSLTNAKNEMKRKRTEYFRAGVRAVWMIDPENYTAEVYTDPDTKTDVPETGTLDGGEILPGFRLPLQKLFARLERPKG